MKYNPITRRQFLVGSGGFLLSIPVLPSLLPKAYAATTAGKRFICLGYDNGRWRDHWYPNATEAAKLQPVASVQYMREMLLSNISGDISQVFSGPQFAGSIRDKMILPRGLEGIWLNLQGHQTSTILAGNLGAGQAAGGSEVWESKLGPSADYIMAKNAKSNPNAANPKSYVNLGVKRSWEMSFRYDVANNKQIPIPREISPLNAFNALFTNITGGTPPPPNSRNQKVVDLVLENYRKVAGSTKIAKEEKILLEDHMQSLSELQAQIIASTPPAAPECVKPSAPGGSAANGDSFGMDRVNQQNVDIMIAAVKCGIVNIGTIMLAEAVDDTVFRNLNITGNWHGTYSHATMNSNEILKITQFMAGFFGRMINGLNVPEPGTNGTYLDNSLVMLGNAMGNGTEHGYNDMPVILAGSLGGKLRTGRYIDYRNGTNANSAGRNYCAFLAMLLTAMGLSPADYQQPNVAAGFGSDTTGAYTNPNPAAHTRDRGVLPGILA